MSTVIYQRKRLDFDNQNRITVKKKARDYFDIPDGYRIKNVKKLFDSNGLTLIAKLVPDKKARNADTGKVEK